MVNSANQIRVCCAPPPYSDPHINRYNPEISGIERIGMKLLRAVAVILLSGLGIASAQTWTPLTHQPTFSASNAYLLQDGRVMMQDTGAQDWWALTPDINGSYQN